MTSTGRDWDEVHLSEDPAIELLRHLGYTYLPPEDAERERHSLRDVVLVGRLEAALRKLNPWLAVEQVPQAVRGLTTIQAGSLIEANEHAHRAIVGGPTAQVETDGARQSKTIRYIDFDHPERNDLVVTRQFVVKGMKKHIIPDIVLFVNGIPLAVIECKSPTIGERWREDGVQQLLRYQEASEGHRGLGAPHLFHTVQVLVAACGQNAVCGTVTTPYRFFGEWKTPYPATTEELKKLVGHEPTAQDVLLCGLLTPANLLDITRTFTVFDRGGSDGRTVRKVCRYQQYLAVNRAAERAGKAKKATDRGGIVWHTQGSGKSLTMLWLALKLRLDPRHENPTIVIVTDRIDLDTQITTTFRNCGFPNPVQADSVRDLRKLLTGPPGVTVLTTIQKFQELTGSAEGSPARRRRGDYPVLSEAANLFVLADEAHRTQYGGLAANMRQALPKAAFFGFTGTPIDKNDRSTLRTFGPYIDQYTIEQAVADGATVPIFYESRLPDLRIIGSTLDNLFDRVFADRSEEEREAIKQRFAREKTIGEAPRRIEAICLDLIDHFTRYIQPNGFKAQVVAVSREAAAIYKETLDRLNAPACEVVFSAANKDTHRLAQYHRSQEDRRQVINSFLAAGKPPYILVVCDMLLTGFDAPIEQVMYLDSPLKEHTLLQAIARVNRTEDGKTYGLVVDYWGVSEALQEALAIFSPKDVQGAMRPFEDELPRLQARHAAALRFFASVRDKTDLEACLRALAPEDVRADFHQAFRRFGQSLDMVLPDPKGLPYIADLRWLGKVRGAAAARFRDGRIDVGDCGEKVRKLVDDAVAADGIRILVAQVPLFSPEFDEKMKALKSDEARASEMEHAIRHEIHVRLEENPAFYLSLRERLDDIIAQVKARRLDAAKQLALLTGLRTDLQGHAQAAEKLGLSETGFAIYAQVRQALVGVVQRRSGASVAADSDPATIRLAGDLETALSDFADIVDWRAKDDVQREMRRSIKRRLRDLALPDETVARLAESLVELLKQRVRR